MTPKAVVYPSYRPEVNKNVVRARGAVDNISDQPLENLTIEVSLQRGGDLPPETRIVSVTPNPLPPNQRGTFEFEYDGKRDTGFAGYKITKLFSFDGLKRTDITETTVGDIVAIAGVAGITIGESITNIENPAPLPLIKIDEPTIAIQFSVNNSPFAGREGQYVTSRNLKERLEKELLTNVSIRVEDTGSPETFTRFQTTHADV